MKKIAGDKNSRVMFFRWFLLGLTLSMVSSGYAAEFYVAPDGSDANAGTSWALAKQTIQAGVDAAASGDTVWVTNGTYATGGRAAGGEHTLTNRVTIDKPITVSSVNGPDTTFIVGAKDPFGDNLGCGSNAIRCVWMTNGATLVGCTLTNGATQCVRHDGPYDDSQGGGVWCEWWRWYSTNDAVVSNCSILGNCTAFGGGGSSGGALFNCLISQNIAGDHGGGGSQCLLSDCTISYNECRDTGGGGACDCHLYNCFVTNNKGPVGGGICESELYDCIIADNEAETGGGVDDSDVYNCTITGNKAWYAGGVSDGTLVNCIVYDNYAVNSGDNYDSSGYFVPSFTNCCTWPMPANGVGNITNNPQIASFRNPRLLAGSPCVNAGTNQDWMIGATDWAGHPRINTNDGVGVVDIGACEFYAGVQTGELTAAFSVNWTNVAVGVSAEFNSEIEGECIGFVWSFGDGEMVTNLAQCTHAFSAPGSYEVVLRSSNLTMTSATTVTVQVAENPVHYVSPFGGHVAPFTSWVNAATTIQDAVDAAFAGGVVWVTNGVYNTGGRAYEEQYAITNRVMIDKPLSLRSVNGPSSTFIVGEKDLASTNALGLGPNAVRCVWMVNGSEICGFTLTNGATDSAKLYEHEDGFSMLDRPLSYGAVHSRWIDTAISNCVLIGNTAYGFSCGRATLWNCLLCGNVVEVGGVAGGSVLYNCTVSSNAAIGVYSSSLYNSVVFRNYMTNGMEENWRNSTFYNSCTYPMPTNGTGNITNDPCFMGAGDFRLQSNSPCINTGTNQEWMLGTLDLAGNSRIIGSTADMGAYEYLLAPSNVSASVSGRVVHIDWPLAGGEQGVTIYRSQSPMSNGVAVTTLGSGENAWMDTNVVRGIPYYYSIRAIYGAGLSDYSIQAMGRLLTYLDFDGDGKADIAVFWAEGGAWYVLQSSVNAGRFQAWGWAESMPVPGDYDGDGIFDVAVYAPENGAWLIWQSGSQTARVQNWGFAGAEPVQGDYDGDGLYDLAVYVPESGMWMIWQSGTQTARVENWGFAEAEAVPADYDGDGKCDLAVYVPESGTWLIWQSGTQIVRAQSWGFDGADPMPGDYDGDGTMDVSVYWSEIGMWYAWLSGSQSMWCDYWGWNQALPVPADYDGDGPYDRMVYAPIFGQWYLWQSSSQTARFQPWGWSEAIPVN